MFIFPYPLKLCVGNILNLINMIGKMYFRVSLYLNNIFNMKKDYLQKIKISIFLLRETT